ncbi:MAG: AAA family ATPase [Bacteroidales bacterium]|nr:AAA family ATPase [Bacteroidales bacterium]
MEIKYTRSVEDIIRAAIGLAHQMLHEFITPEHVLTTLIDNPMFIEALGAVNADVHGLKSELERYLFTMNSLPKEQEQMPELSSQFQEMLAKSAMVASRMNNQVITVPFVVDSMLSLKDSWAQSLLSASINGKHSSFMSVLMNKFSDRSEVVEGNGGLSIRVVGHQVSVPEPADDSAESGNAKRSGSKKTNINFTRDISELCHDYNKIIGRKNEMAKIIESLCRYENKNVLLIGEAGVGKTAMVYGLAQHIEAGDVPKRLKNAKVFEVDIAGLAAGAQFRGELEARIRTVLDSIVSVAKSAIVYIDGIQMLMSIGQSADAGVDVINTIKSYFVMDNMFFIGSSTHDEFSKYSHRNKSFISHFQRVDINEPSKEDSILILEELKEKFEKYHKVTYTDEAIKAAVDLSVRHVRDRFLPDKAIDLIDQAGAHSEAGKRRKKTIGKEEIAETIKIRYNIKSVGEKDETQQIATLESRIKAKIYGQDQAIKSVVESVHLWKAGLTDREKPIANLLFVGPTGVGKTEVARTLAEEMNVPLVRFDMSEYVEKHTVAKLIGSPAGYVGYDDGGLLTEAILKNPNCVLLLDEIEKAHSDIYNILLQVMDYGSLTDSRGKKADFQNVVLIMTSNAGAQYAHTASLGFGSTTTSGSFMLGEVKKTFKPEFINRLTGTVVFNDMDETMADMILDKKVKLFAEKLNERSIDIKLSNEAHKWLLNKGITKEYGAREIDRVLGRELKPLFVKEILFGKLKKGGNVVVSVENDELRLDVTKAEEENAYVEIVTVSKAPRRKKGDVSGAPAANVTRKKKSDVEK